MSTNFFERLALSLVSKGFVPGQVTTASCFFGLLAAAGFWRAPQAADLQGTLLLLFVALLGLWGRAICERIDDLMVENIAKPKARSQFLNEIPERVSETAIFLAAAFTVPSEIVRTIGFAAALFSVITAYIRVVGVSAGVPSSFAGPMAKRHRVIVMTICVLASGIEKAYGYWGRSIAVALLIIAIGALITCLNRMRLIYRTLSRP